MTQTITRLYDNYSEASRVVEALKASGIPDNDISLVANNRPASGPIGDHIRTDVESAPANDAEAGAGIGGAVGAAAGLLAGLGLIAIPGIGPVVAAGWLASTAAGAVAGAVVGGGAGGLVGALVDNGTSESDAHVYAESVRRGGALVTVRVSDDRETEANRILSSYSAVNPIERGEEYRQSGWQRFDETWEPPTRTDRDLPSQTGLRGPLS